MKFILFFVFGFSKLFSTPILFQANDVLEVKSLKNCEIESNLKIKNWNAKREELEKEIFVLAKSLAKERVEQINCLKNLKLNEEERMVLNRSLEFNREKVLEVLEYNNRFFYYLERKNYFQPGELKLVTEFNKTKFDLYELLNRRTIESILKTKSEYSLKDFQSIYLSILRYHLEFYFSLNTEVRKKIFTSLQ